LTERVRPTLFPRQIDNASLIDFPFDLVESREMGNDGHYCSHHDSTSLLSKPPACLRAGHLASERDARMVALVRSLSSSLSFHRPQAHSGFLFTFRRAKYGSLAIQSAELQRAIDLTRYAAFRVRELEREAAEEGRRFTEFAKWLRYGSSLFSSPQKLEQLTSLSSHSLSPPAEVSVATTEDSSSEPSHPPTHDVLLVADYLQTSFVQSRIDTFFQSPPISPPPPPITIPSATPILPNASLFATIASTIRPLAQPSSFASNGGRHGSSEPGASGKEKTKMLSPVLARRGLPRLSADGMEVDGEDGAGGEKRDHGILEVAGELVGLLRKVFGAALGPGAGLGHGDGVGRTVEGGEMVREWVSKVEVSTSSFLVLSLHRRETLTFVFGLAGRSINKPIRRLHHQKSREPALNALL